MPQQELLALIQEKRAPLIIDVRTRGEYERDHLPGAVHVPFYSVGSTLADLNYDKANQQVVLYCEHGPRAGVAWLSLYMHGYERLYSLEGHMKGWRTNGLPVESGSR